MLVGKHEIWLGSLLGGHSEKKGWTMPENIKSLLINFSTQSPVLPNKCSLSNILFPINKHSNMLGVCVICLCAHAQLTEWELIC